MTDFLPDPDNSDNVDGPTTSYHMDPDEFRRHGYALIDWLAHYMEPVGVHVIGWRSALLSQLRRSDA